MFFIALKNRAHHTSPRYGHKKGALNDPLLFIQLLFDCISIVQTFLVILLLIHFLEVGFYYTMDMIFFLHSQYHAFLHILCALEHIFRHQKNHNIVSFKLRRQRC